MNTMLEAATVTVRPPARWVVVMPAAASMEAMIQPPNISPAGLVSAGIASWRAARSPRGTGRSLWVVRVAFIGRASNVSGRSRYRQYVAMQHAGFKCRDGVRWGAGDRG